MITPDLANEIKNSGHEVIAMGHAYRVNGLVDIWYNGRTLFELKNNKYYKFNHPKELIKKALLIVDSNERVEAFKKTTDTCRMSYQEFKNRRIDVCPQYYHWSNDKTESDDCLYFIKSGVNVKIGRSINPAERLQSMKTAIAETPKIILVVKGKGHMEKVLHRCFSQWRIRKNAEWFLLSDEINEFIKFLRK